MRLRASCSMKSESQTNLSKSHAPQPGHFLKGPEGQKSLDGSLDQVDRVRAAVHLGQDVAHAAGLEHVADTGARLDTRSRAGRYQNDPAAAVFADDPMRDRLAAELDTLLAFHASRGVLDRLIDGRRHFVGLVVTI